MSKRSFRRTAARTPRYPALDRLGRQARLGLAAGAAAALIGSPGCGPTTEDTEDPPFGGVAVVPDDGGSPDGRVDGGHVDGGFDAGEGPTAGVPALPDAGSPEEADAGEVDAGEVDAGEWTGGVAPLPDGGES